MASIALGNRRGAGTILALAAAAFLGSVPALADVPAAINLRLAGSDGSHAVDGYGRYVLADGWAAFVVKESSQGKDLNGVPILPPYALKGMTEPVLVSSRVSQNEIVRQMREDLRVDNRAILLY